MHRYAWLLFLALPQGSIAERPPVYETLKSPYGDVYLWGIASQGYVWTDRYSFFGSDDDPFNYREISLGGQYEFLGHYSVNVQGEYRDAGQSDNLGVRLTQGFLDANFNPWNDAVVGANLGRVEIPFGFYNRTRDRVDTRPSIILPQSVYLESSGLRDYILTGDGGMLYGLSPLNEDSRLEAKVGLVKSSFGDIEALDDAALFSGWLSYVWKDKLKLRVTLLSSEKDGTRFTFPVLSGQYTWDKWAFTSEWGRLSFDTPAGSVSSNGVYGQVEYVVSPELSMFARYDYLKFDVDTPVPIQIPGDLLRAQSFAVGFGYNLAKNFRLNAEYHLVDGKAFLSSAENPGLASGPGDYSMVAVMASVRF